ncbi:hypothetical protein S1OALGB6SA_1027 [Olavius algarvensis spirochete endosymbiont]|uniref:hypothetical protein n=1 Tax=Olavius algarvensis spirochete endosymbiont TaxID=260710 RepID=UPI000F2AD522|nr:hypothetical protein [Olavius algarvensis spirochete endosymbiont]VDA99953.1 hypothetical protein S1OALGB6SA_1027 [Olavius algarvensis spirochete endosymbiont]
MIYVSDEWVARQSTRKLQVDLNSLRDFFKGMSIFVFMLFGIISLRAQETELAQFRTRLRHAAFPENDETRRLFMETIMAPSFSMVETEFEINKQRSDGRLVWFEVRRALGEWYVIFRNQRGNLPEGDYPLWGRGNWIIKKDLATGRFVQAKIFLQDDRESFVRIFPGEGGRSLLDVQLYGQQLGDDVLISLSFEALMLAPFAKIVELTENSMAWEVVFPDPSAIGYRYVENLVEELSNYTELIQEMDDGAVDEIGNNVFIESVEPISAGLPTSDGRNLLPGNTGLNCSGFVKWVVDGIYSVWRGKPASLFLAIDDLRQPTSRLNWNPWGESLSASNRNARENLQVLLRDPMFGLDWNRNLGRIAEEARLGRSLTLEEIYALETFELSGIPYQRDLGISLESLDAALYQLAVIRPGTIYLAAVNSRFLPAPTELHPNPIPLHQYWHVSILAPWFDDGSGGERGNFRVAVLDVGDVSESLLPNPHTGIPSAFPSAILRNAIRYARLGRDDEGKVLIPEVMIHLVRLDVPANFEACPLPEARRLSPSVF